MPRIARVSLLDSLPHIDKLYDYFIPDPLRAEMKIGGFVCVPFGTSSRQLIALVVDLLEKNENPDLTLKPILGAVCPDLVLTDEQMRLSFFIKEHTFSTHGDAVRTMLPAAAFAQILTTYTALDLPPSKEDKLRGSLLFLYQYIKEIGSPPESRIIQRFGKAVLSDLDTLVQLDAVRRSYHPRATSPKTITTYSLAVTDEDAITLLETGRLDGDPPILLRGAKQQLALSLLLTNLEMTDTDLHTSGVQTTVLRSLIERGLVKQAVKTILRDPFESENTPPPPPSPLTPEQEEAVSTLRSLLDAKAPRAALLHGITGSGKTRVMKAVIDEVIASGRGVILLVPEIALTPQTVAYFRAYYGGRTAVLHSMLSPGERYDAWRAIKDGKIDLVIGTRSAVFAPMKNLGAILIDEEQEHTYKSDQTPKYHAIDIARFRVTYHGALMLLASATPSFESYTKAKQGKYTLITLKNRYGGASLPEVARADLRKETAQGRLSPVGLELKAEIEHTLSQGKQAILFVGRRGYHNYLTCPLCGATVSCPNCSVTLTQHTDQRLGVSFLRCHYCGHAEAIPETCPACHGGGLRHVGYGTQKAQEHLQSLFPSARILRMDADTTSAKSAYRDILSAFRAGEGDILLGTQMVTKGHDFPNVTLVGVLNADSQLYIDDFRAAERTFSLLTQVVGRAGRADSPGKAVIQTYSPDHTLFCAVAAQDYDAFYESEIALRRSLVFPPFCDLVTIIFTASDEPELLRVTAKDTDLLKSLRDDDFPDVPLQIFGPMEAPIYRLNDVFRMRLVIKCRLDAPTRALFHTFLEKSMRAHGRKVSVSIDPAPESV